MSSEIRVATAADIPALQALINESARILGMSHYSAAQIEGALEGAWGGDTQLIADETYFVVEAGGVIVACGGWSYRAALFGGDAERGRVGDPVDPIDRAARITTKITLNTMSAKELWPANYASLRTDIQHATLSDRGRV